MNSENLPKKPNFLDRVKRAFSALKGNDPASGLTNWSTGLEEQEIQLDGREEQLKQREEQLEAQKKENDATTRLYAEEKRIPEEIPKEQVNATRVVCSRFENLAQKVAELEEKAMKLKDTETTKEDRDIIKCEYAELKGRLLGEFAVAMETLTEHDIATTVVGDKSATLGLVAKALPKALGIVGIESGVTVFRMDDSEIARVTEGASKSLGEGLRDLHDIGFLRAKYSYLDSHNISDFDLVNNSYSEPKRDDLMAFLNTYFGISNFRRPPTYTFDPTRNYKKPDRMKEMNISNNPVIGSVVEQVGNLSDRISDDEAER